LQCARKPNGIPFPSPTHKHNRILAWENIFDDFVSLSPLFVLCRVTAPGDKCCAARQREKRDGRRFIPEQRSRVEEGEQPLKQKEKEDKQETVESNSGRQELRRRSLSRDKRPDGGSSGGSTAARASTSQCHQPTASLLNY
jgi:hypothetical protein